MKNRTVDLRVSPKPKYQPYTNDYLNRKNCSLVAKKVPYKGGPRWKFPQLYVCVHYSSGGCKYFEKEGGRQFINSVLVYRKCA